MYTVYTRVSSMYYLLIKMVLGQLFATSSRPIHHSLFKPIQRTFNIFKPSPLIRCSSLSSVPSFFLVFLYYRAPILQGSVFLYYRVLQWSYITGFLYKRVPLCSYIIRFLVFPYDNVPGIPILQRSWCFYITGLLVLLYYKVPGVP